VSICSKLVCSQTPEEFIAAQDRAALKERGIPHDVKEYQQAGHSFLEQFPVGPLAPVLRVAGMGYEEASANDAWRRIRAFFDTHLTVGPGPDDLT
jgi:carboxymethylenebutenolidase